jgi:hypothetical protein
MPLMLENIFPIKNWHSTLLTFYKSDCKSATHMILMECSMYLRFCVKKCNPYDSHGMLNVFKILRQVRIAILKCAILKYNF